MITINITLIVQAINFGIAYLLLRFLLFKPAIRIIAQEQAAEDKLHSNIAKQKAIHVEKERVYDVQIQTCHQFFVDNKPLVINPELMIFKGLTPSITPVPRADDVIQDATREIKQALIQRIKNVF